MSETSRLGAGTHTGARVQCRLPRYPLARPPQADVLPSPKPHPGRQPSPECHIFCELLIPTVTSGHFSAIFTQHLVPALSKPISTRLPTSVPSGQGPGLNRLFSRLPTRPHASRV